MDWMRWIKIVLGIVALWLVGWLVYEFAASERTQMLRVQDKFIHALEARKWRTVDAFISSDYADEFGQDAGMVKQNLRTAFGSFFFLSLQAQTVSSDNAKGLAWVKQTIKADGNGPGLCPMVVSESKRIKEPWIFHWHKRGFWPWSWELVQVHNPQAHISL